MSRGQFRIGTHLVDLSSPVAGVAPGGLLAFSARAEGASAADAVAIVCRNEHPARLPAILRLMREYESPGLLRPIAQDAVPWGGASARVIVCAAPPGPALMAPGQRRAPVREADLIRSVVRPIGSVLVLLEDLGLTHRGIRPDNLFLSPGGGPAVLGDGFALPPGFAQPAAFEEPSSALCLPAGRGDGTIGDDLYALGVTLVALATGRWPLADLDDAGVVRAKLERGSLAAIVGEDRLPAEIATLVRRLLAEDPDRRPRPAELAGWPGSARTVAVVSRPVRRATRSIRIGPRETRDLRSLAVALGREWSDGIEAVRSGAVAAWLERTLGETALGGRLRDLVEAERGATDPQALNLLLCSAIAAIDPKAPLFWRGAALFPESIGPLLAESLLAPGPGAMALQALSEMIDQLAMARWASASANSAIDAAAIDRRARQLRLTLRSSALGSGAERLLYGLNPALPCLSPLVADQAVTTLPGLLRALDAKAGALAPGTLPLDRHIAAFIAVQMDGRLDEELARVGEADAPAEQAIAAITVFALLQRLHRAPEVPGLSRLLGALATPATQAWHERARRDRVAAELPAVAATGDLSALHALVADPEARARDHHRFAAARRASAEAAEAISRIVAARALRQAEAQRIGGRVAHGAGLVVLALTLLSVSGL